VGMGIDESGHYYLIFAIDFDNSLTIPFQPGIAQSIFRSAH